MAHLVSRVSQLSSPKVIVEMDPLVPMNSRLIIGDEVIDGIIDMTIHCDPPETSVTFTLRLNAEVRLRER